MNRMLSQVGAHQPVKRRVLGWGTLLSIGLAATVYRQDTDIVQGIFYRAAQHVQSELQACFTLPVHGLHGLRGAFASAGPLSRRQFEHYVAARDLTEDFSGVLGMAFVEPVQRRNLSAFLAATRADHAPSFAIHSLNDSGHDDLYVVKYIAPLAQNASALGLDLGSDPARRRAIEQAVRSGRTAMSEGILLLQDNQRKQLGVLINVPVYANNAALDSPAQRQAALIGIVNAPAVVSDLIGKQIDIDHSELHIRLFGPTAPTGSTGLWYDNQVQADSTQTSRPQYISRIALNLYGQPLELEIASTSHFEQMHQSSAHWWVMIAGLLLSAGMALSLSRHLRARRQADNELERAQLELQEAEQSNRNLIEALNHNAIVSVTDKSASTSSSSQNSILN